MEYNARVCNHKYVQHEGEARGLYVLVVTHECIILIQPSLGCINWFVAQYTQVQGECRQCVVISATTGQYHDIALATGQYRIYCPGGSFDLRHRWATMTYTVSARV